jgi:hypothetical protein
MLEEIKMNLQNPDHKTNRDWQHDSSESRKTMSDDEDSKPSAVWHLDNNNNGNNQGINLKDFEEDEDYEPTDDFNQKIIKIFSWTHNDLVDILEQTYIEESILFTKNEFAVWVKYGRKTSESWHIKQCKNGWSTMIIHQSP